MAVADTDSYLKWSLATLAGLPADWSRSQVLLRNAVMPSPAQVADARTETQDPVDVQVLGLPRLVALLARDRPDVLLLACTGPVVETLTRLPALRGRRRPVLLTGLPGISVPASPRAVLLRRTCDLLLVHSHRERREFAPLAAELAPGLAVGLARLPFLPEVDAPVPPPVGAGGPVGVRRPGAGAARAWRPGGRAPGARRCRSRRGQAAGADG